MTGLFVEMDHRLYRVLGLKSAIKSHCGSEWLGLTTVWIKGPGIQTFFLPKYGIFTIGVKVLQVVS